MAGRALTPSAAALGPASVATAHGSAAHYKAQELTLALYLLPHRLKGVCGGAGGLLGIKWLCLRPPFSPQAEISSGMNLVFEKLAE